VTDKKKTNEVNKTLKNMQQQAKTESHLIHGEPVVILKQTEFVELLGKLINLTEEKES